MSMVYQVIIRRAGSMPQNVTVGEKLLHFGSGKNSDLVLADETLPAIAGRLFMSSGNQIILFNLGAHFTLDGTQVPSLEPTIWKPGVQLQIGNYSLELKIIDIPISKITPDETPLREDPQTTRPPIVFAAPVQLSAAVMPNALPEVSTYVSLHAPAGSVSRLTGQMGEEDKKTIKDIDSFRALDISEVEVTEPVETGAKQWFGYSADRQTQAMPPIIEDDTLEDKEGFTRFKNWMEQDKLSVQLGLKTVNFAPGERIMLPLSVRNNYSHPLELLVSVVGIPADWVIDDAPIISLAAGELKTFEVVLLTRPTTLTMQLDAFLYLTDRVTPEISAHLPLPITLKDQSDLTGGFEQSRTLVPNNVYLTLQNQTLSTVKIRLSIGPHDSALRVVLPNSEVDLAPYQKVRIPIRVDVVRFPLFVSHNCALHISAQQGTRAPLDLATVVSVQPSLLRYLLLIIIIGLLGVSFWVITKMHGGLLILATSTPTLTTTFTPTVISTATVLPTEIATSTVAPTNSPLVIPTEVILPTNTALPFIDPRGEACQASIAIPNEWTLYIIQRGENLFRIATNHNISMNELARVNCIRDAKHISVGQKILVPHAS